MEIAGLILAMVATTLIAYALPLLSERRHAIATSREVDRFSTGLMLVEVQDGVRYTSLGPSSRPLLSRQSDHPSAIGAPMSQQPQDAQNRPAVDGRAAREYASLRAGRAARISREKVAAQRRLLTAGLGMVTLIAFIVMAATGVMGWIWALVPAAFLAGSVAASVVAGERTKKRVETEDARLAELRDVIQGKATNEVARKQVSESPVSRVSTQERIAEANRAEEVVSNEGASDYTAPEDEVAPRRTAAPRVASTEVETGQEGVSLSKVSGGEWDYVPLPRSTRTASGRVTGRTVHPDTDIVSVSSVRAASVPARPVRATPVKESLAAAETSSGPTFRFDLDAVLDQRRAQ